MQSSSKPYFHFARVFESCVVLSLFTIACTTNRESGPNGPERHETTSIASGTAVQVKAPPLDWSESPGVYRFDRGVLRLSPGVQSKVRAVPRDLINGKIHGLLVEGENQRDAHGMETCLTVTIGESPRSSPFDPAGERIEKERAARVETPEGEEIPEWRKVELERHLSDGAFILRGERYNRHDSEYQEVLAASYRRPAGSELDAWAQVYCADCDVCTQEDVVQRGTRLAIEILSSISPE